MSVKGTRGSERVRETYIYSLGLHLSSSQCRYRTVPLPQCLGFRCRILICFARHRKTQITQPTGSQAQAGRQMHRSIGTMLVLWRAWLLSAFPACCQACGNFSPSHTHLSLPPSKLCKIWQQALMSYPVHNQHHYLSACLHDYVLSASCERPFLN